MPKSVHVQLFFVCEFDKRSDLKVRKCGKYLVFLDITPIAFRTVIGLKPKFIDVGHP